MSQVRYQPLGPLLAGEGSRAFLGLAIEDGVPPRPVVLVWAPPEVAQDKELCAQLQRETQHATVFDHPNIIRVHGWVDVADRLARVTEFADGESLRRLLEVRPRIPPAFAAKIVTDVAMGAHYAHMAGNDDGSPLIHGDLRPETVMVSFSGVCMVTGYGALGVAPRERNGNRVRNQHLYGAPEQLIGGREAVTVATDVFLLGLLLYECLSGRMPFQDAPDADRAILTRSLPPLPVDVPRTLDEVVRRATAKRATDRYPSARAFRDAVVQAIDGLPSAELFADFLSQIFPPDDDARATRRQMIEIGLAEAARQTTPAGSMTPPTIPPVSPPVPVLRLPPMASLVLDPVPEEAPVPLSELAPPVPTSERALEVDPDVDFEDQDADALDSELERAAVSATPGVARPFSLDEEDRPVSVARRYRVPLLVGAVVAVASIGGLLLSGGQKDPTPSKPAAVARPAPEKAPTPVPPPEKETVALAAGEAGTSPASDPLAAGDVEKTPRPARGEAPAAPDNTVVVASGQLPANGASKSTAEVVEKKAPITTKLQLVVQPPVEVLLEGKPLGRTPLTVPLEPGAHELELRNPAKGVVKATRSVTVKPKGTTKQSIRLAKGTVQVRAPAGSSIFVDSRKVRSKLSLYEGEHQLVVTSGVKRWEKSFQLGANERLVFNVEFEKP
jgi:eukaryotic-like serine/threonine-protein kinase